MDYERAAEDARRRAKAAAERAARARARIIELDERTHQGNPAVSPETRLRDALARRADAHVRAEQAHKEAADLHEEAAARLQAYGAFAEAEVAQRLADAEREHEEQEAERM